MKIRLKVLKGSASGKEVKIPTPECIIGRSSECHLRPKSDAISRRHCSIIVEDGNVIVRDFGSKNGTYVNGRRVKDSLVLKPGDQLHVGPLAFEVLIDRSLGGEKKAKVSSIKEAALRTTENAQELPLEDGDISNWLDEADELARERRMSDPETRQLKMDETDQVTLQKTLEERGKLAGTKPVEEEQPQAAAPGKGKKKKPGKLPQRPESVAKDSREAAAAMLRKFFTNR